MFTVTFTRYDGTTTVYSGLTFEQAMNTVHQFTLMALRGETVGIRCDD